MFTLFDWCCFPFIVRPCRVSVPTLLSALPGQCQLQQATKMDLPLLLFLPNSHFQESLSYILARSLFCLFNIWSRKGQIQNPLSLSVGLPRGTGILGAGRVGWSSVSSQEHVSAGGHSKAAALRVVGAARGAAHQPDRVQLAHEGGQQEHLLPVCPQPAPGRALPLLRGHEEEGHGGG